MPTLQLIVSLLTIIGSGVVSAVVTYRLNARKAEREFLRAKLETLYLAIDNFTEMLSLSYLTWLPVLAGRVTAEQALEINRKSAEAFPARIHKTAEMLVSIYFPQLDPYLSAVMESRTILGNLAPTAQGKKLVAATRADCQIFDAELTRLNQRANQLKKAVCSEGHRLGGLKVSTQSQVPSTV